MHWITELSIPIALVFLSLFQFISCSISSNISFSTYYYLLWRPLFSSFPLYFYFIFMSFITLSLPCNKEIWQLHFPQNIFHSNISCLLGGEGRGAELHQNSVILDAYLFYELIQLYFLFTYYIFGVILHLYKYLKLKIRYFS